MENYHLVLFNKDFLDILNFLSHFNQQRYPLKKKIVIILKEASLSQHNTKVRVRICFCCLKLLHCYSHQIMFKTLLAVAGHSVSLSILTHLLCEVRSARIVYWVSLETWVRLMPKGGKIFSYRRNQGQWRPCAKQLFPSQQGWLVVVSHPQIPRVPGIKTVGQGLHKQFHKHQHLLLIILPLWRKSFPISAAQKATPPLGWHSGHNTPTTVPLTQGRRGTLRGQTSPTKERGTPSKTTPQPHTSHFKVSMTQSSGLPVVAPCQKNPGFVQSEAGGAGRRGVNASSADGSRENSPGVQPCLKAKREAPEDSSKTRA